jgi:hypothetical protein
MNTSRWLVSVVLAFAVLSSSCSSKDKEQAQKTVQDLGSKTKEAAEDATLSIRIPVEALSRQLAAAPGSGTFPSSANTCKSAGLAAAGARSRASITESPLCGITSGRDYSLSLA